VTKSSTADGSQAHAAHLEVRREDDLARSELPEVTEAHMAPSVMRKGGVPVEHCIPFGQEYICGDVARNPYSQGLRRASSWGPTRRRI
jgi:hypothetical protein